MATQNTARAHPPAFPTGTALEVTDRTFRECPHAVLDTLRNREPVHRDRELDRVVLTGAVEIAAVLSDRSLSRDPFKARATAYDRRGLTEGARTILSLLAMDDPDHRRVRTLVVKAFNARRVESLRPLVEGICRDLLADLDPSAPFELIAAYASPLPILVIAAVLGIDDADVARFKLWSEGLAILLQPVKSEADGLKLMAAMQGLGGYLHKAIADRRERPRDDLLSALVGAEHDGDTLTETEILHVSQLLLVAGNLTTTDLIGNGVVALLHHPAQLARLRSDPGMWPAAVEEMLRYDPPVMSAGREALEAREIGGCPVEAGQTITAVLMAANHDPALHTDPHAFDIARKHQKHHSFGGGAHFCLGASLARLEAQVALCALFEYFPKLRKMPNRTLERKNIPTLNGYSAVWLEPA